MDDFGAIQMVDARNNSPQNRVVVKIGIVPSFASRGEAERERDSALDSRDTWVTNQVSTEL